MPDFAAECSPRRDAIVGVATAALRAVDPEQAILSQVSLRGACLRIGPASYDLDAIQRIIVVGGGKASVPMATAIYSLLGERITGGAVTTKVGHSRSLGSWRVVVGGDAASGQGRRLNSTVLLPLQTGPVAVTEASHPVPDAAGELGAQRIANLLSGMTSRDLVIVLISGGGSALLPLPMRGISLPEYQALTDLLLRSGADITEINTVRRHCSSLQGGQLARMAAPAHMAALVLSDVVGSPLNAIASGPTVADPTTFADAAAILRRYAIADQVPCSVCNHIERGVKCLIPDTPKPGDPLFERVTNVIVGDNTTAARAAVTEASRMGLNSLLLSTFVQGEAREVGRVVAGLALGIALGASDVRMPACLVLGGETTVTVRGDGLGGRNQELALAAAIALDGCLLPAGVDITIVGLATDGTDGPTDAAGGAVGPTTVATGRALGLDARAALARNDSYHYLAATGNLLWTGPTNTNVNDLIFVFAS